MVSNMKFQAWICLLCAFIFPLLTIAMSSNGYDENSECKFTLVESIPTNMTYPSGSPMHPATYEAWLWLIGNATSHIGISSFYWTLRNQDVTPKHFSSSVQGENILKILSMKLKSKKIALSIVNNGLKQNTYDLGMLKSLGADVRYLEVERLLGGGILHSKLWTADNAHAYIGSANMDWRSLTEVKELGVHIFNCSVLVKDLLKIQQTYQLLSGSNSSIPTKWPSSLQTNINIDSPLKMKLNGIDSRVYFGASPPQFLAPNRTVGITSLVNVIAKAKKFVYIAVMDYFPLVITRDAQKHNTFWPVIDDALRQVAIDSQIEVRLLISMWTHSSPSMWNYLRSLAAIKDKQISMNVKMFKVPGFQNSAIPFSRVNHNKYMVTDNIAYIGTSNWSGDYFVHTCGVGLVIEETVNSKLGIRGQLQSTFERDWNSPFAETLTV